MKKIVIVGMLVIAWIGTAVAQSSMSQMSGHTSPATDAYMQAMNGMNEDMKNMTTTGDPSKDFVMMMSPHHQAAVEMAEAYLKYGKDPQLTRMAKNILKSQKKEIAQMQSWMSQHGMK